MGARAASTRPQPTARWNRVYLAVYLGYLVLGLAGRWSGWQNGDQLWFVDAARHVLDGSWHLYDYRPAFAAGVAPPLGVPYSYTPLLALLLAPFVALADALQYSPLAASVGGRDELAYRLIVIPMLIGDVLALDQLRRLAHAWCPGVDEVGIFLGTLVTLFLSGFLLVSASNDHHEGLVLWLILLTLRLTPRSAGWGGILAGLTLAAKQTAVLALLPIGAVLLAQLATERGAGSRLRAARRAALWGGLAGAVFALFLVPPLLVEPDAVVYAIFTLPLRLVLFGPGVPGWLDLVLQARLGAASPAYTAAHAWILSYANAALLLVAVAGVAGALAWSIRRGRPLGLGDSRLLALIAFCGLLQVDLGKWVSSHYYQLPLALVLLWDVVRSAPAWPFLGLATSTGFRAMLIALPLPVIPFPRGAYLVFLFAWLTGVTLGAACRAAPGARAPPAAVRRDGLPAATPASQ